MRTTGAAAAPGAANILLVDDQPAKLMSYELCLAELGQNLIKANSAREALELLLKHDVAVILADVCMPDLDGFELARLVREHPRFKDTAIIFVSAIHLSQADSLKGYELGGVDYVPVPVVPGILRAKVRVFVDLYLKTRELARLNADLETRVRERTAELEAAVARQELLAREVDHRARNALAVVQSIVSLTANRGEGEDFAASIKGRIRAMADAHGLLASSRWGSVPLHALLEREFAPFAETGRIVMRGEAITVAPRCVQNLALVVHELVTNAAKYGALSGPCGELDLSWRLTPDLVFQWRERCQLASCPPARKGFGTRVIDGAVAGQLGGAIVREWSESGLILTLTLPADCVAAAEKAEPPEARRERIGRAVASLQGRRVFVVEDEPLVAMELAETIRKLGGEVVGPISRLDEANACALGGIDIAVLDVQLGRDASFGLADRLLSLGIPFVFATGYQRSTIPTRFAAVQVLTKPVEPAALEHALVRTLREGEENSSDHNGVEALNVVLKA